MAKETLPKSLPHDGEQRHGTVRFAGLSNSLRSYGTAVGVPALSDVTATTGHFLQAISSEID